LAFYYIFRKVHDYEFLQVELIVFNNDLVESDVASKLQRKQRAQWKKDRLVNKKKVAILRKPF